METNGEDETLLNLIEETEMDEGNLIITRVLEFEKNNRKTKLEYFRPRIDDIEAVSDR